MGRLCHANMTSFVRSTWAVGSISGALSNRSGRLVIKPVQAAAPLRVLYLSCFFFCCQGFHFYSLLILPNIPIGPNSEMVRSIWFLTEISGILGCVESAHNLMIWSDGKQLLVYSTNYLCFSKRRICTAHETSWSGFQNVTEILEQHKIPFGFYSSSLFNVLVLQKQCIFDFWKLISPI